MDNSSSLSNVVSSLVRAQMGSSLPRSTLDEELDKRVAELILKEARQKEARYLKTGSYLPQTSANTARPNKRFLSSIIKSTDEHNKTVLRAQAEAANEVKRQREQEEREERMRRAREAVAARAGSSSNSWRSKDDRNHRWRSISPDRHGRHGSSQHEQKRERGPYSDIGSDREERQRKRRRRDDKYDDRRSRSPSRRRDRDGKGSRRYDEDDRHSSRKSHRKPHGDDDRRKSRRRSRSRSVRRGEDRGSKRASEREDSLDSQEEDRARRRKAHKREQSSLPRTPGDNASAQNGCHRSSEEAGSTRKEDDSSEGGDLIGPRPTSSRSPPKEISSKMDKYFAEDYDPRLDIAPALSARDGFIPPGAFDDWNMMLQVVRVRREEKEEKKRLEKLHHSGTSSKKDLPGVALPRSDADDLLGMQYTKRGGVREWDEGKKETQLP